MTILEDRVLALERQMQDLQGRHAVEVMPGAIKLNQNIISPDSSSLFAFMMLPGLRGLWPMTSFNESVQCADISGQGRTLTAYGGFGLDSQDNIPTAYFNGSTGYMQRADENGLTGTWEKISLGGWVHVPPGGGGWVMAKWASGATEYGMTAYSGGTSSAYIQSAAGTRRDAFCPAGVPDGWRFTVMSYNGVETRFCVNGMFFSSGIYSPSSGFTNGVAPLYVGAFGASGAPSGFFNGRMSIQFLSGQSLSDDQILSLFNQTRGLYGI